MTCFTIGSHDGQYSSLFFYKFKKMEGMKMDDDGFPQNVI